MVAVLNFSAHISPVAPQDCEMPNGLQSHAEFGAARR